MSLVWKPQLRKNCENYDMCLHHITLLSKGSMPPQDTIHARMSVIAHMGNQAPRPFTIWSRRFQASLEVDGPAPSSGRSPVSLLGSSPWDACWAANSRRRAQGEQCCVPLDQTPTSLKVAFLFLSSFRAFLNPWFAKPMVCMWVAFHENDENHENDEDNSDSYEQGVKCWISGNHRNHINDENTGSPGCKPRVPQTTGLELPDHGLSKVWVRQAQTEGADQGGLGRSPILLGLH